MKKIHALTLIAAAAALCSLPGPALAGSLTLDDMSPAYVPPESFTNNTIMVDTTVNDPSLIHLTGGVTVTPDASNVATVSVGGTYSADQGDIFSVAYQFAADLNNDTPVNYTLSGTIVILGVPVPFETSGTIDPGLHVYSGSAQQPVAFQSATTGEFSGTLTLDFSGTNSNSSPSDAAPGTLDLSVQQLDFQLSGTPVAVASPSTAQNISTRANVGTGENVLIGGFIISGTEPKQVVLRAIGPSLQGITEPLLADPVLELHDDTGGTIATNDNWMDLSTDDQMVLMANDLTPPQDAESALVETLDPGEYTAVVRGAGDTTGVALVEVYALPDGADATLANISSRATVDSGDNVAIAGFIVGGSEGFSQVIVRGIGPSLSANGIDDPLVDPFIEVHNKNGDVIASNDNWMDDPNMQTVIDDNLAPPDPTEAALYDILAPGEYTAILSGGPGATVSGVGVIEVYQVNPTSGAR
jgi:hypothetical protein